MSPFFSVLMSAEIYQAASATVGWVAMEADDLLAMVWCYVSNSISISSKMAN